MTNKKTPLSLPYRDCVGIVVFNEESKVWAGRRIFNEQNDLHGATKLWQMPQGGIDEGETPIEAARRELYEETGIYSIEVLGETDGWLNYTLPEYLIGIALKGKYCGQRQKWFAFRFIGKMTEIKINPPPDNNNAEFDAWDWVDLEDLPLMVVPFKQSVYEKVVAQFRHFIV
ncbi:RNA pyrophosphohydrolase [Bartonella tamiae]|uniref:RNA pyrophosphohydrolase n=1 Tax=Bartonella tamiae Th239 TaxID=1094558 RepID=J0ZPC2_9HYPH|nr:RNA pyrophosphohydrolase [Bartonella tamiae]EJF90403.1 hypothetical protein ME5_00804 [Bartonella tamiae Th239]EJF93653.1 hypothetical protein MEG_01077 [Bartonella tamiae Th307]